MRTQFAAAQSRFNSHLFNDIIVFIIRNPNTQYKYVVSVTLLGDDSKSFGECLGYLQASSYRQYGQQATYTFTGKWVRRVTRHKQTHSAAEQQESQTASVHYRKIQANTVIIYPIEQHINLTHYTALALI